MDLLFIGVGVERSRGNLLRERESRSKRDPFFSQWWRWLAWWLAWWLVGGWWSGREEWCDLSSKKLLFAISFLRFEAHLNRALCGGSFQEETGK